MTYDTLRLCEDERIEHQACKDYLVGGCKSDSTGLDLVIVGLAIIFGYSMGNAFKN